MLYSYSLNTGDGTKTQAAHNSDAEVSVLMLVVPPMYGMQYSQTPAARRSWSTVSAVSAAVDANLLAAVTAAQWVAASYAPMPSMRMVSAWEEGGEISHRS